MAHLLLGELARERGGLLARPLACTLASVSETCSNDASMVEHAYPRARGLLSGKSVVVTAAAGTGIGFATAKRCVEEGARIVISDAHEARLIQAADALSALAGEPVLGVRCDVTREDDVQHLIERSCTQLGAIDVLISPRT